MPATDRTVTHALAERHEALWLSLAALHKDVLALGAKKPQAPVPEPLRIAAEGLLSDCAPFIRHRREKLPVAAPDLAGLAAQLGQALAGLEAWQSLHTTKDELLNCLMWRVAGPALPVMRLKPPAAALVRTATTMNALRDKLAQRIDGRRRAAYQEGFAAGRAARLGPPEPEAPDSAQTYPRLRQLD